MTVQEYNDYLVLNGQALALSGTQHNVVVTSSYLMVTPANALDIITGFEPPVDLSGGLLTVTNVATGAKVISLPMANAGSLAANRLVSVAGVTEVRLAAGQSASFNYINGTGWSLQRGGSALVGTTLEERQIITVDFSATFGLISALVGSVKTQSIPGLLTTDGITLQGLSDLGGVAIGNAWCSAADTLSVRFITAIALGLTLGSANFRATIFRKI